jgi:hypothetical protein
LLFKTPIVLLRLWMLNFKRKPERLDDETERHRNVDNQIPIDIKHVHGLCQY